jgi:hypothetical protein
MSVERAIRRLVRLMAFQREERGLSTLIWVAVYHWPIQFIITGNKNLFLGARSLLMTKVIRVIQRGKSRMNKLLTTMTYYAFQLRKLLRRKKYGLFA